MKFLTGGRMYYDGPMNQRWLVILLLITTAWNFDCASKKFNEPGELNTPTSPTQRTFRRSYTDVWNATLTSLQNLKYAVSDSKRDGGLVTTDWISGKSDRLFSGYGETRIPYTVRFRMTVKLVPSQQGVKVSIDGVEQYYSDAVTAGTDFSGSIYQWMPTKSTGSRESALLDAVEKELSDLHPAKSQR